MKILLINQPYSSILPLSTLDELKPGAGQYGRSGLTLLRGGKPKTRISG